MVGVIIGAVGAVVAFKVLRHRRCRARGGRRGFMARRLGQRLGTTPEQQKVLEESFEAVQRAGWKARAELPALRADAAKVMRAESLDEGALAAVAERARAAFAAFDASVADALKRLHPALTPEQRQKLADLLEFGPRAFH